MIYSPNVGLGHRPHKSHRPADPEAQQRFINLVDVLVDKDVPVRFSAQVDLDDFLADASQRPDAFRMASRLRLLQSATVPKLSTETSSLITRFRYGPRVKLTANWRCSVIAA